MADVSTVMNLDISLRNALRKLRMKGPEDIVEWIQIINRRASTQIMMILVFFPDDYDNEVFATLNS